MSSGAIKRVRQGFLAALLLVATFAEAEVVVEANNEKILIGHTTQEERRLLQAEPDRVRLRVAALESDRSVLVTLTDEAGELAILPRFPLREGTDYVLSLVLPDRSIETEFSLSGEDKVSPRLVAFSPSQAVLPANILRVYISFSQPMARGQLQEGIALFRDDGTRVESPFLNLSNELWDPSQTRLTLLFDPGRIKQGVGPNSEAGPPLEEGRSYRLEIPAGMRGVSGQPMGNDATISFRVGPPERRKLRPETWAIQKPTFGTQDPISVAFDRIMDAGAVVRLLRLIGPDGTRIEGEITTDGGGWSIAPKTPWVSGTYHLAVDPTLEDVSGNTIGSAFDATTGTIGQLDVAELVLVEID